MILDVARARAARGQVAEKPKPPLAEAAHGLRSVARRWRAPSAPSPSSAGSIRAPSGWWVSAALARLPWPWRARWRRHGDRAAGARRVQRRGLLEADIERHFSRSYLRPLRELAAADVEDAKAQLQQEAETTLRAEVLTRPTATRSHMKYEGQSFSCRCCSHARKRPRRSCWRWSKRSDEAREAVRLPWQPDAVQIVNLRATARVEAHHSRLPSAMRPLATRWTPARAFRAGGLPMPVIERSALQARQAAARARRRPRAAAARPPRRGGHIIDRRREK